MPRELFLTNDDLDRQLVLHRRCELRHRHREAAVAAERHDLPLRVGDLGGDGVGQGVPMMASVPETEYICPALHRGGGAPHQVVFVPQSALMIASSASRSLSARAMTCGFIGDVVAGLPLAP